MIMATMTELAQRMLTKRPTVARTSEIDNWFAAKSPTRASDPRTEITRPKDVTMDEPEKTECFSDYAGPSLDKRLNGRRARFVKSATIPPLALFPMHTLEQKRPKTAAFLGRRGRRRLRKILPFDESVRGLTDGCHRGQAAVDRDLRGLIC
ncbi:MULTISPECIES: hypothetical protein [Bradyrhizobium]|uniref:hypothetical protein n=1 Tax=Bradyrhizobium TaxID=374 RepID=UPI001E481B26|nr:MULTISPECIES: hypothetical protein [Bradyrhizobium]UFW53073.1 hypothetical protein BaraCB756_19540 [Bradyrhizobium arachidis]